MLKVCILAAGVGKRNSYSTDSHKSLLTIHNRAIISIIMDSFPRKTDFIVAVGHNKELIKDYLSIAESQRNYKICEVKNYSKKFSGPATSLLSCKKYLNQPFIFISCDTIIKKLDRYDFKYNWVGISEVEKSNDYLIFERNMDKVINFFDKKDIKDLPDSIKKPYDAFIGLAGIYDYKLFWKSLETNKLLVNNELQVSNGFNVLIKKGLKAKKIDWKDVGSDDSYKNVLNLYSIQHLPKKSETLFIEKNRVIKFFKEKNKALKRFNRSKFIFRNMPKDISLKNNFLSYRYMKGNMLSEEKNKRVFLKFLEKSFQSIWKPINLEKKNDKIFRNECDFFYRIKTFERVNFFLSKKGIEDRRVKINNLEVPKVKEALKALNWTSFNKQAIPVKFHGDPQPENIIHNNDKFFFIDWRECFGKNLLYGDIYYDFAKIHHALIVSGKIIRSNNYHVDIKKDEISLNIKTRKNLINFLLIFEKFLINKKYNLNNVRLMSIIIYLNIAALHDNPYDEFLFFFGRYLLQLFIENKWPY